jgi:hypothetical protein
MIPHFLPLLPTLRKKKWPVKQENANYSVPTRTYSTFRQENGNIFPQIINRDSALIESEI